MYICSNRGKTISVEGEIMRPAIFELSEKENLGGFNSNGRWFVTNYLYGQTYNKENNSPIVNEAQLVA